MSGTRRRGIESAIELGSSLAVLTSRGARVVAEKQRSLAAAAFAGWDLRRFGAHRAVAVGFSGWGQGVGGVRNHVEAIRKFSRHDVRVIPGNLAMRVTSRREYSEALWKNGSDVLKSFGVLHSHVDPQFIRACSEARSTATKWIHTYHTLYFEDGTGPMPEWSREINRTLLGVARHADLKICVSPWLQELLSDEHGIETTLIPNGVDVELCDAASATRFIDKTGLKDFVVYIGSLDLVKNAAMIVDLAATAPELVFVMVGKGLDHSSIRARFGSSLGRNVVGIGPVGHREALDAIAASRCLVMTSRIEGFPTALLEAMAMGKPVVAPDNGGCRDAIGGGNAGFLFESGSLEAAREALKTAVEGPAYNAAASQRIRELFDWRVVAPQLDDAYSRQTAD